MNNYYECQANAAECERMVRTTVNEEDRIIWQQLAAHWRYLSPKQGKSTPINNDQTQWRPTLLGT
jgi:hypothetical protein